MNIAYKEDLYLTFVTCKTLSVSHIVKKEEKLLKKYLENLEDVNRMMLSHQAHLLKIPIISELFSPYTSTTELHLPIQQP